MDSIFGTKRVRITGNPGDPIPNLGGEVWPEDELRHGYSKRQPWNADESMIYLDRVSPELWLDGETYEVLFTRRKPGTRVRWSQTDPRVMFYLSGDTLGRWYVREDETELIARFPGYRDLSFGNGEGNFSYGDEEVAILATRESDDHFVLFVVDVASGEKEEDIDLSAYPRITSATISPLGNYLVIVGDFGNGSDRVQVRRRDGSILYTETEYGLPSHFDAQVDREGREIIVGVAKTSVTRNGEEVESGELIRRDLETGAIRVIGPKYPSHVSGRNYRRRGWVFVTYQNEDEHYPPYLNEAVAVNVDTGEVERIVKLHAHKWSYASEAHVVPSPSGDRIMWASDWETGTYPVQAYVADMREKLESNDLSNLESLTKKRLKKSQSRFSPRKLALIFGKSPILKESSQEHRIQEECASLCLYQFHNNLRKGDRDGEYSTYNKGTVTEVRRLQEYLKILGFYRGTEDGIFGPLTEAAVKHFQSTFNLNVDGIVGKMTRKAIHRPCVQA